MTADERAAGTREEMARWYEQNVGYDPVADDPSITNFRLRLLCVGYAEEAGIECPFRQEG